MEHSSLAVWRLCKVSVEHMRCVLRGTVWLLLCVDTGDGRLGTCSVWQDWSPGGINAAGTRVASSPLFTATLTLQFVMLLVIHSRYFYRLQCRCLVETSSSTAVSDITVLRNIWNVSTACINTASAASVSSVFVQHWFSESSVDMKVRCCCVQHLMPMLSLICMFVKCSLPKLHVLR